MNVALYKLMKLKNTFKLTEHNKKFVIRGFGNFLLAFFFL